MFCSTIIPTVGRDTLARAVESVLKQHLPGIDFELIVVNDSGAPLPPADWQKSPRVRLLATYRRERSVARNTGAAVANGRYLQFLDDDDWLEPDALHHLHQLASQSDASWLYGSSQLRDRQLQPLIQLHHRLQGNSFLPTLAGEWIPLQASLIRADIFFAVGGFNPLLSGPEDIDLLRRVALRQEIAGTEAIVANILFGEAGSTTDYDRHPEQSRWAREQILDQPGVFQRMRQSTCFQTGSAAVWHGRILRVYLTSAVWNGRRRRILTAGSRLVYAAAAAFGAGPRLFAPALWRALSRPYASETFARGQAAARQAESGQPAG
ncbi:MAG: glycosyltransferase family A protein [Chloroflexota bacterium]